MPPLTLDGTTGVSAVQAGAVESGDLPAGSVIQVVSETFNTQISTTSSSFVDTGLSATITPNSINNKIMVVVTLALLSERDTFHAAGLRLTRNNLAIFESTRALGQSEATALRSLTPISYLDVPSSNGAITYKVQGRPEFTGSNALVQFGPDNNESTITLMEIAG